MVFNLDTIVRKNILSLKPYRCARDDFKEGLLLDANENTHGPALASILPEEQILELNRYPDPHQITLKAQICAIRNSESPHSNIKPLTPENLCLGVGSDESIDLLMRCVCNPGQDKLLICPPTYGMYSICANINDVEVAETPLTPDFEVDVSAVAIKVSEDSTIKLLYLTSPGNPTGKLLSFAKIEEILKIEWNGLVIVDEAYVDFAPIGSSFAPFVTKYPNLVVLQTLSKSYGLAGIRLGITFASEELSRYLNAMKYPYNISTLTSNVALRATSSGGLSTMKSYVSKIIDQRDVVLTSLQRIKGVGKNLGGLDSNFILLQILSDQTDNAIPSNEVAKELYNRLATESGVVVRFRGSELNCTGCLRITIGTHEENLVLISKFKSTLESIYKSS